MDLSLPQAYLIGLLVLLGAAAVLVARQILRVRADEVALARLEAQAKTSQQSAADLYELASVQLRKRLYGQAVDNLKRASKSAAAEPPEAQALIENALGFALAAQSNYGAAIKHYRAAIKAKADYPVALNNLAYALEKQQKPEEATTSRCSNWTAATAPPANGSSVWNARRPEARPGPHQRPRTGTPLAPDTTGFITRVPPGLVWRGACQPDRLKPCSPTKRPPFSRPAAGTSPSSSRISWSELALTLPCTGNVVGPMLISPRTSTIWPRAVTDFKRSCTG